jgi:hypothetical protein
MLDAGVPMIVVIGLWTCLRAVFSGSVAIALENLALRHVLLVLQRSAARPRALPLGSDPLGPVPVENLIGALQLPQHW